jgi:SAM-dependent methyltransferase
MTERPVPAADGAGGARVADGAIPSLSARDTPRFRSREDREHLASAFQGEGDEYDRLRPGYPDAVVGRIVDAAGTAARASARRPLGAVDLGAGTGKLSLLLADRGLDVTAVDPSSAMLEVAARGSVGLRTQVGTAEATGLPDVCADVVTVAQAWHWFDTDAACAEIARILRAGGLLALVWNSLDVQIPWVHRLSRIMHAGDVHKDDFVPPMAPSFTLEQRVVERWEQMMPTHDLIDLARTRSYMLTAPPQRREKVLANLDWYVHEHLGHVPGSTVGLPYRTDLFLFRPAVP